MMRTCDAPCLCLRRVSTRVRDEDYATGKRQHEALQSGLLKEVLFGRNERGGQVFHQWAEKLANADDADVCAIFSAPNPAP